MNLFINDLSRPGDNQYRNQRVVFLAVGLLLLLVIIQALLIWKTPFTSGDDQLTSIIRFRAGGIWQAAVAQAEGQGRFYALLSYSLAQLPYLVDGYQLRNFCSIACNVIAYWGFYFFVRSWLNNFWLALFAVTTLVALMEVRYGYNPFHGLPLWFSLAAGLICVSFGFWERREFSGPAHFWSCIFFAASLLFYETFLLYTLAFLLLDFRRFELSRFRSVRFWFSRYLGLTVVIFIYLAAYFGYMKFHPASYSGTKLSLGTAEAMLRTVAVFSLNGTKVGMPDSSDFVTGSAVFGILVFSLALICLRQIRLSARVSIAQLFLVSIFIFMPNVLYALTERYREWVKGEPYYLGGYYSAFATSLLIVLGILYLFQFISKRSLRTVATCGAALILGLWGVNNYKVGYDHFKQYRPRLHQWTLLDEFLRDRLSMVNIKSIGIVSPTLLPYPDPYDYWSTYLSTKYKAQIKVYNSLESMPGKPMDELYYAIFIISGSRDPASLVIGRLSDDRSSLAMDSAKIYTLNREQQFQRIEFETIQGKRHEMPIETSAQVIEGPIIINGLKISRLEK